MKKLMSIIIAIAMILSLSLSVSAAEIQEVNSAERADVVNRLQAAIENYSSVQKNNSISRTNGDVNAKLSNFRLSIDYSRLTDEALNEINLMTDQELRGYVANAYNIMESDAANIQVAQKTPSVAMQTRARWTQKRYGDVWCGIPNGGWAYIRIYYGVTWEDNGGFTAAEYYDSWKTNGVTAGNWEPHFGNATVVDSSLVEVTTTGTITYGIPDTILSASFDATFLYEDTCPYEV